MKVIRTVFMPGANLGHFAAAMQRVRHLLCHPWNASDGTSLDYGRLFPYNTEPASAGGGEAYGWGVRIAGAGDKDIARTAAILPWLAPDGVRVDFVDGAHCYGDLKRAHIGESFREFAAVVAPFLENTAKPGCAAVVFRSADGAERLPFGIADALAQPSEAAPRKGGRPRKTELTKEEREAVLAYQQRRADGVSQEVAAGLARYDPKTLERWKALLPE